MWEWELVCLFLSGLGFVSDSCLDLGFLDDEDLLKEGSKK